MILFLFFLKSFLGKEFECHLDGKNQFVVKVGNCEGFIVNKNYMVFGTECYFEIKDEIKYRKIKIFENFIILHAEKRYDDTACFKIQYPSYIYGNYFIFVENTLKMLEIENENFLENTVTFSGNTKFEAFQTPVFYVTGADIFAVGILDLERNQGHLLPDGIIVSDEIFEAENLDDEHSDFHPGNFEYNFLNFEENNVMENIMNYVTDLKYGKVVNFLILFLG
jgi:hypothetical protein